MICPCACYGAAAVVCTGLRKEPCEPGGNCVKSPCELLVRWLADRRVCMPSSKEGREGESEEGGGQRRREGGRQGEEKGVQERHISKSKLAGSWLHVRGCLSSCREEHCPPNKGGGRGCL